jgi:hypothetical protein
MFFSAFHPEEDKFGILSFALGRNTHSMRRKRVDQEIPTKCKMLSIA